MRAILLFILSALCLVGMGVGARGKLVFLKSLRSAEVLPVGLQPRSRQLFVLFQKDCEFCRKQMSESYCLPSDVNVTLLGVGNSEADLREELVKMRVNYPAYKIDRDGMKVFNFSEGVTPQALLQVDGRLARWTGYKSCRDIGKQVAEMEPKK